MLLLQVRGDGSDRGCSPRCQPRRRALSWQCRRDAVRASELFHVLLVLLVLVLLLAGATSAAGCCWCY